MALKDWKKISKNRWRNKNNYNKQIVIIKDRESGWEIIPHFIGEKRVHIKTKSQAIEYAKAHRQKH